MTLLLFTATKDLTHDAIGSQVGLKEILKTNFPDKKVLVTGVNEPTLSWIAEMDRGN